MFGLYSPVDVLAKDGDNNIFLWSPSTIRWESSYGNNESPLNRLSELFNINQFILSQAQPYIAPFISQGNSTSSRIIQKLTTFVGSEISFRLDQVLNYSPAF
jgi:TAG lipase/lysophosphatidylethanolamine acyltransferase